MNRRVRFAALEIVVAVGAALGFWLQAASTIRVDPLDRIGQVSGLAGLGYRFALVAIVLVVALVIAARARGGRYFELATRLVCAALAGVASGFVAGGVAIALHGTPYALNGVGGDAGVLVTWAELVRDGRGIPSPQYPPLQIYGIAWIADLRGVHPAYALKTFHLLGVALISPAAYLAWRMLLRPAWALGVGVVAALPLIEAYRPYPLLVLVAFIPTVIAALHVLRTAAERSTGQLVRLGAAAGLGMGLLCLLYSGWFQWSAPGVLVATAVVFPWRTDRRAGALFCAVAAIAFALVTARYLVGALSAPAIADTYFYFDTRVDPAYFALWRGDLPGPYAQPGLWPPIGELGGVGVYSVGLFAGLGVALALGLRRTEMIVIGPVLAGTWLFRFVRARLVFDTHLVQLYPRTSAEILYCLLAATGLAVYFAVERKRVNAPAESPLLAPSSVIGAVAAMCLLVGSAASSISDRYMPDRQETSVGWLAMRAQRTARIGGPQSHGAGIDAPTSHEGDGWSRDHLADGKHATAFSTQLTPTDHEEAFELQFLEVRAFSKLVIVPAEDGFPPDFQVEVFEDEIWTTIVDERAVPPPRAPLTYRFDRPVGARRLRFRARKLSQVDGQYALRLREIELF